MKIMLELLVFCGVFTLMVKLGTGNTGLNSLYFYPEEYRNIAYQRGLADPEKVRQAKKKFMPVFILVLLVMLVVIVHINKVSSFWEAYRQVLLFLQVMNWFDRIVIDRIWVGSSRLWIIEGMEDIPFVKPWKQILRERVLLSGIWVIGALIVAVLVWVTGGIG